MNCRRSDETTVTLYSDSFVIGGKGGDGVVRSLQSGLPIDAVAFCHCRLLISPTRFAAANRAQFDVLRSKCAIFLLFFDVSSRRVPKEIEAEILRRGGFRTLKEVCADNCAGLHWS